MEPIMEGSSRVRMNERSRAGKSALALEALAADREAARKTAEAAGEGDLTARIRSEIAEKRVDLFLREHDVTGAWKRDRFGRDIAADLQGRPWERNEEGKLTVTAEDEKSHVLLVNMGDLDRLNAAGDHSLGDTGLRMSANRIETVIREVLGARPEYKDDRRLAGAYGMYRYSGNDFSVNLRGVEEDDAEEIRRRLSQESVPVAEGEEPVPLVASRVSRADGIELLNGLEERPEDAGLATENVLISAMLEKAQALNDVGKTEERANRMADKILLAEAGTMSPEDARKHYDQFLKKSLGAAFKPPNAKDPLDYDAFRALVLAQRGSLEEFRPTRWTHTVAERSLDSALESLKTRRSVGRSIELNLARKVADEVLKRPETFGTIIVGDAGPESTPEFTMPVPTRGMEEIQRVKDAADGAEKRRAESKLADATADLRQVEHQIERAKRDSLTGLYQRGVFFETMEAGLGEKKPIAVISIDMAFLKYFDKEGGPACGNLAIEKAGEILDTVAREISTKDVLVEAYRMGGDEFSFTVVGGGEDVLKRIKDAMKEKAEQAGRVPSQEGAKPTYRAESLLFNFGTRSASDSESFKKDLEAMGIPLKETGTPMEQNELAGYMMRLADKEVEIQKGYNRMTMLIGRAAAAKASGDRGNLDTLMDYSQKAIFGKAGADMIAAFAGRLAESSEPDVEIGKIRGEILTFLVGQIDGTNQKKAQYESSLDRRLEDAVRIRFFEQRVRELEDEIESLNVEISREREGKKHLERAVAAAEAEKQAVVELREKMQGGPSMRKAA